MPGFTGTGRPRRELPFGRAVPGFFDYLAAERGLRPESIVSYRHHLASFEAYQDMIGVAGLRELPPAILSAFVAEHAGAGLAKRTVRGDCGVLRVFGKRSLADSGSRRSHPAELGLRRVTRAVRSRPTGCEALPDRASAWCLSGLRRGGCIVLCSGAARCRSWLDGDLDRPALVVVSALAK